VGVAVGGEGGGGSGAAVTVDMVIIQTPHKP
jgi:hypothetical protein